MDSKSNNDQNAVHLVAQSSSGASEHGEEYKNKLATFHILQAYQSLDGFWMPSDTTEMAPFDNIIISTNEKSENIAHLFHIKYSENVSGEELTEILQLCQKLFYDNNISETINKIVPTHYKPIHVFKVNICINEPMCKNDSFILKHEQLFNTKNGEVYELNVEDLKFHHFMLYANQSSLEKNIRSCMEEFLQEAVTDEVMNNFIKYIHNWSQIPATIGLSSSIVRDLLEYSVLQNYSLPIKIIPNINYDIHGYFLWECIKDQCIFVNQSHLSYVIDMISKDVINYFLNEEDSFTFLGNILFGNFKYKNITSNQKYSLCCFLGYTPFILKKELSINLMKFRLKYIPTGNNSPKNLSLIGRNKFLELLDEKIILNCGRTVALHDILSLDSYENLASKLSVSDILSLINREYDNKDINLFKRKIKTIFLQMEVLNNANEDLFIINISHLNKQIAIAIMDINEDYVCSANCSEATSKYIFVRNNEEFKNFTKPDLRNIHFVKIIDKNSKVIEWFGTLGNFNQIKRFQNNKLKDIIDLKNIHNYFHQSLLIISGPFGIGKSIAMKQIALSTPPNIWVLHVDLKSEEKYFEILLDFQKNSKIDSTACLNYFYKNKDAFLREIFNIKLENKEMLILFDAFDEIAPTFTKVVCEIIKRIQADGYRIILTTDEVFQKQIEDVFGTFSILVNPLNQKEQAEYLSRYFEIHNNNNKLSNMSFDIILNQLNSKNFFNRPLFIELFSNILLNNLINTKIENLLELYEEYINIHLQKFTNVDKQYIEKYNKYIAVQTLLKHTRDYGLVKLSLKNALIICSKNGGNKIELISSSHRSIAEYYVAKWLWGIINIKDETYFFKGEKSFGINILKKEIFKKEFSTVRLFFNLIVNQGCKLHEAILSKNFIHVKESLESDIKKVFEVNLFHQTLLHTIISNCDPDEKSYFLNSELIQILYLLFTNYPDILTSKDFFYLTPLDYAEIRISTSLLTINLIEIPINKTEIIYFVTYNMPFNLIEFLFAKITKNIEISRILFILPKVGEINFASLVLLIKSGYFSEVIDLLKTPQGIIAVDENENNLIHWAVESNNIQFLSVLFSHYNSFSGLLSATNKNGDTPFLLAVQFGHLDILKLFIGKIPKLTSKYQDVAIIYATIGNYLNIIDFLLKLNYHYLNPLPIYIAFKQKNITILEYLLRKPIESNNKLTCLHYAATYKNKFVIEAVIKLCDIIPDINIPPKYTDWFSQSTDLNAQSNSGLTPLMFAIIKNNTKVVNYLIRSGSDLNCNDKYGNTSIHHAVLTESMQTLQVLCQMNTDINAKTCDGFTPLHLSVINRNFEITQFLIDCTADLNCVDNSGRTCLHYATEHGDEKTINLLCQNKPDTNKKDKNGRTPLHIAIENGNFTIVKLLIANEADVKIVDKNGSTCLHFATGIIDIIKYLIPFYKDVNMQNSCGNTPLHWACIKGKLESVKVLINQGANPRILDNNGTDCKHFAASAGDLATIQYLTQYHKDPNIRNNFGITPLHLAAEENNLEIVQFLINSGANPQAVDKNRTNSIHFAARAGATNVIKYISQFYNNLNVTNRFGETPLHWAIKEGNFETIKFLIDKGSDPKSADDYGNTGMHQAVKAGVIEVVKYLIQFYSNINVKNRFGTSPIQLAVKEGNLELLKFLISYGGDPISVDNYGYSCMHCAAYTGNIETIKYLIQFYSDINLKNIFCATPLHCAVKKGQLATVKFLISIGANLKSADVNGTTCLHYAGYAGVIDVIKYLAEFYNDLNVKDRFGKTPLHLAAEQGKLEAVKFFVSKGVDPLIKDRNGTTCMHFAVDSGSIEIIKYLFEFYKDLNIKNNFGKTPLHFAVKEGKLDVLKFLINNGANPQSTDNNGYSCVHFAAHAGDIDVIKYLIQFCDVNIKDCNGTTPLHWAIITGKLDTIKFLINNGAEVNCMDNNKFTCVHYAAYTGVLDVIKYLIPFCSDVNVRDNFGKTPLHSAARQGKLEALKLLIRNGADPMVMDNNGSTIMHYAAKEGFLNIVKYLYAYYTDINIKNEFDQTPLLLAIENENVEVTEFLIAKGAAYININSVNTDSKSLFTTSIQET